MLCGLIFRVSIQKTFMLRGELIGKNRTRRDAGEQGKCRTNANDQRHAHPIDDQMKKLGRLERYDKELAKITKAKNLPPEWATPEQ